MAAIYLDYNATTPVDPAVASAIRVSLDELWGNPSSSHDLGIAARSAIQTARGQVAELIGAKSNEILFTGGGTEASNLAIKGMVRPSSKFNWKTLFREPVEERDLHLITTSIEHPATTLPIEYLRRRGAKVTVLPVDGFGRLDPDRVRKALRFSPRRVRLVSVMHSNNEVGTLQPIREIGDLKAKYPFVFHTDCAQSLGKVPVSVNDLNVDLLTLAGHKLYAPKGIGALYIRSGIELEPLLHGAPQENGLRAGTENTPYIVGLGVAAELARKGFPESTDKLLSLRDRLHSKLKEHLGEKISLNGHPELRLPNTLNLNFHGWIGPQLLAQVPGICASVGAACHEPKSGETQFTPSAVLCAMKVPPNLSLGAVRLSVGRFTTVEEVDRAAELLTEQVKRKK